MAATWRVITILLWCISMHILGLYLFSKGFLLTRVQIRNVTDCRSPSSSSSSSSSSCSSLPPKFSKFIILVVDALRFDFADFHDETGDEVGQLRPYQNKMPIFRRLEAADPTRAKLFEFIADPPTTTMQRLQGLTTGSLPTFVDVGANFDGYQVVEDNFLSQFNASGKSIVFAGDDTWMHLFPRHFLRQFPFPSFNVRDLHTVDEGVKKHVLPEMAKSDWSLLIGHLLGVDHCGHRYGPDHPEMAAKLTETNEFLERVVENLDDDTLLVVMGDHGMTSSGDHGGDSDGELSAALFVHAKKPFVDVDASRQANPGASSSPPQIPQIDLIPTLSLLAGTGIPFSNLGQPILDLFPESHEKVSAVQAVVAQVSVYLDTYGHVADDIPAPEARRISELHGEILRTAADDNHDDDSSQRILKSSVRYLQTVRQVCERIWAKFDVAFISIGLAVSALVALVAVTLFCDTRIFVEDAEFSRLAGVFGVSLLIVVAELTLDHLPITTVAYLSTVWEVIPKTHGLTGFFLAILAFLHVVKRGYFPRGEEASSKFIKLWHRFRSPSLSSAVATVVVGVVSTGAFSNSFVVSEDRVAHFALTSVLWFVVGKTIVENRGASAAKEPSSSNKGKGGGAKTTLFDVIGNWRFLLLILAFCASGAMAWSRHLGQACREEQFWCEASSFLQPLSSFQKGRQLGLGLNIR